MKEGVFMLYLMEVIFIKKNEVYLYGEGYKITDKNMTKICESENKYNLF